MKYLLVTATAFAAVFSFNASARAVEPEREKEQAQERLSQAIQLAIHANGPLLQPEERALVERKCGYAPGSWDGSNFSMNNGVLECANGRRVDDPEVRAMMDVAGPRISRHVSQVMQRPEIRAAIADVAHHAQEAALRNLSERRRRRD